MPLLSIFFPLRWRCALTGFYLRFMPWMNMEKFLPLLEKIGSKALCSLIMKITARSFGLLLLLVLPMTCMATLSAGVGKADITPPIGTPSAGYTESNGQGMEGIHDPLLATALFIDNGEKKIVFCSVDHLGFTYD